MIIIYILTSAYLVESKVPYFNTEFQRVPMTELLNGGDCSTNILSKANIEEGTVVLENCVSLHKLSHESTEDTMTTTDDITRAIGNKKYEIKITYSLQGDTLTITAGKFKMESKINGDDFIEDSLFTFGDMTPLEEKYSTNPEEESFTIINNLGFYSSYKYDYEFNRVQEYRQGNVVGKNIFSELSPTSQEERTLFYNGIEEVTYQPVKEYTNINNLNLLSKADTFSNTFDIHGNVNGINYISFDQGLRPNTFVSMTSDEINRVGTTDYGFAKITDLYGPSDLVEVSAIKFNELETPEASTATGAVISGNAIKDIAKLVKNAITGKAINIEPEENQRIVIFAIPGMRSTAVPIELAEEYGFTVTNYNDAVGDSVLGEDEECEDGNQQNGDGCDKYGKLEANCENGGYASASSVKTAIAEQTEKEGTMSSLAQQSKNGVIADLNGQNIECPLVGRTLAIGEKCVIEKDAVPLNAITSNGEESEEMIGGRFIIRISNIKSNTEIKEKLQEFGDDLAKANNFFQCEDNQEKKVNIGIANTDTAGNSADITLKYRISCMNKGQKIILESRTDGIKRCIAA
ncbi:hypothetical protein J4217_04705 [Candidatus Pacearchaeota archaeon]|nr:hypothetical protein [Candidatus Pacearchaeota archaeon]